MIFCLTPLADWERKDFLEVIEDRYQLGATIIASQCPISEWHPNIGDPTLADAICDRLFHNAYRIELKGRLFAAPPPPPTTVSNQKADREAIFFDIFNILVYHDEKWICHGECPGCLRVMLKRLNIDARMERNVYYSRFIFEKSILRQEEGTLSGGPGFAVIAAMETGDHKDISKKIKIY